MDQEAPHSPRGPRRHSAPTFGPVAGIRSFTAWSQSPPPHTALMRRCCQVTRLIHYAATSALPKSKSWQSSWDCCSLSSEL